MDKDYARKLSDRWAMDWNVKDSSTESARSAIEGAIREALAKAVQIADEQAAMGGDGFQVGHHISMQLRALGAKPSTSTDRKVKEKA